MTMTDQQFSQRDVPWMKIGVQTDEAVTAADAMQMAGLDWNVDLRPAGFRDATGTWRSIESRNVTVREDTNEPLGIVSDGYEVLQYSEAFDFMDQIQPRYVAAGSLRGGRQGFMVVQAPEHAQVTVLDGQDPHDLYVVLRTSHDGTRAVEVSVLPLRGACMNMMPVGSFGRGLVGYDNEAKQRWSIRHTKNMHGKLAQAQDVLTGLDSYTRAYEETASQLAAIELELEAARRVLKDSLPAYYKTDEAKDKQTDAIMDVYEHSTRNGFVGNGWGLLNAVTEYHEHYRNRENRQAATRWVQGLDGTTTKAINATVAALRRYAA